jgi:hypothetical protein
VRIKREKSHILISNNFSKVPAAKSQNEHTPPYFTTTVCPRSDLEAADIVPAMSEKFSGAAEIDDWEIALGVDNAVDDDGAVKADAAENSVAVKVKTASNFIVEAGCCV